MLCQRNFEFCHFAKVLLTVQYSACKHNNTQQEDETPPPYPPAALHSLSVCMAAAPTTHGAAAPYGPMQGARHWVRRHHWWFPCLGCKCKPHQNIERKMGPWP